jgi:hypothetical protein
MCQPALASIARPPVARNIICWRRVAFLPSREARLKQDTLWNLAAGIGQICCSCRSLCPTSSSTGHSRSLAPEVISSYSTNVVTEFPLTKEYDKPTVVIGKLERNAPRAEPKHTELYCSLTWIWLLGCVFFLTVWWHRHCTMKTRLREGEDLVSGSAFGNTQRVKGLLQERRPVTLILSSDFPEPGVCGIRRPKLVLPKRVARGSH